MSLKPSTVVIAQSKSTGLPSWWKLIGPSSPHDLATITIFLKPNRPDLIDEKFNQVSNPKSAGYQEFLSIDQIKKLSSASESDQSLILDWIEDAETDINREWDVSNDSDSIVIEAPVSDLSKLLHTRFHCYHMVGRPDIIIHRIEGTASIPERFKPIIQYIGGLTDFPPLIQRHSLGDTDPQEFHADYLRDSKASRSPVEDQKQSEDRVSSDSGSSESQPQELDSVPLETTPVWSTSGIFPGPKTLRNPAEMRERLKDIDWKAEGF